MGELDLAQFADIKRDYESTDVQLERDGVAVGVLTVQVRPRVVPL